MSTAAKMWCLQEKDRLMAPTRRCVEFNPFRDNNSTDYKVFYMLVVDCSFFSKHHFMS